MTDRTECCATLRGSGITLDAVSWELDSEEQGGVGFIDVRFDVGGIEATFTLDIETAEQFLQEARDEIVRAKRKELERGTDTDPGTGIEGE